MSDPLFSSSADPIIQAVSLDTVLCLDRTAFNSCNHGVKPTDYEEVLARTRLTQYIDILRPGTMIGHIDIRPCDLTWLKAAYGIGQHTGLFPKTYDEDLTDALPYYEPLLTALGPGPFFIRTDSVSLKNGQHGAGPYQNMRQILESLGSCRPTHTPIDADTKSLRLYFFPWLQLAEDLEFRVFVYRGQITAISQQHCYQRNKILTNLPDSERQVLIRHWVKVLADYINTSVIPKLAPTGLHDYTIDIALLSAGGGGAGGCGRNEDIPYLIELNCFGPAYAAGSSLFSWIKDNDILLRDGPGPIYFRYVSV